jgi:outer membrane receptor for ferrienterochelin and colicin
MKKFFLILSIIMFILPVSTGQNSDYKIFWKYEGQSFKEFADSAESHYKISFYYKSEWINNIRIGKYKESIGLSDLLGKTFNGTRIYYFIDDKGNIILSRDYKIKTTESVIIKGESYIPGANYTKQSGEQKTVENLLIEIGNPSERSKSGNVVITGYVKSKDTKEPVTGATVYVKELSTGTVTNEYGFYTLNIPRGNYNIRFTYMGMKETSVKSIIYGSGKLDLEMKETLIPLKETIVIADKNNVLQRFEVGLEKINMKTFRLMPTSMGESDILKGMLLIPGVKTVGEGSSGFNVRGGAADQNLILLYGAPVFNTSHFFGFFAAVNSDIIKDVLLYKGGIPSQYGGRISSVVDIIAKDGNKKKMTGNAGISPVTTHLLLEIPVIKDKMSLVLAGRITYSNYLLGMIKNQALRNSKASFYDLNGRLVYEINSNNRIELSSYLSKDEFKFNFDTTYNYMNRIVSLKWRHTLNNNFIFALSANTSFYKYIIESNKIPEYDFALEHRIGFSNLKADFNWYRIDNHKFNFGLDLNMYNILPGKFHPISGTSLNTENTIEREKAIEGAIYAEDKIKLTENLSLNIGLRFSFFSAIGPKTISLYYPDQPLSFSSIYDTLEIMPHKIYKTYSGPEYRISLNYKLTGNSSVKLNYNRTRQYLHLLTNTTAISPTDTWKLSDYYIKPQTGDQYAIGYYFEPASHGFEISAEAYYKNIQNMIDFKGGSNLIMNGNIESDIINVSGRAYGIELMIKKSAGKLNWNISYTYSRILVRSNTQFQSDAINSGNWFPASYDKPHDFAMMLSYFMTRRASFSMNYTYSTGRPITYPVAVYENSNMLLVQYSERNKYRIPYYSRLDISARFSGNLKSHKLINPAWTFSVYNLLGRDNVYSVYFKSTGSGMAGYKLSIFAVAIPTLAYSFDF